MSDFYVSASQLMMFLGCPAKYAYTRSWKYEGAKSWWLQDGIDAHALLAGENVQCSARALRLVNAVKRHLKKQKYEIVDREVRQLIQLGEGIVLQRTIDAFAMQDGRPVLLDYKFVTKPWEVIDETNITPKAWSLQAAAYLIPPEDPFPFDEWPMRMVFIVADNNKIHEHEAGGDPEDVIQAALLMRWAWENDSLPRNPGFLCARYCDMRQICFEEDGWEELYDYEPNFPDALDRRYR